MARSYKTLSLVAALVCLMGLAASHSTSAAPGNTIFEGLGDIIYKGKGSAEGLPSSHFPHWNHRILYRCYVCHEKIFKMERGANKMSMKLFKQGKLCGECHNGKEAYKIGPKTCKRCHNKKVVKKPKP